MNSHSTSKDEAYERDGFYREQSLSYQRIKLMVLWPVTLQNWSQFGLDSRRQEEKRNNRQQELCLRVSSAAGPLASINSTQEERKWERFA